MVNNNNISVNQKVLKPVIIAICGKSASGKDTLARWLVSMLKAIGMSVNIIVNDTTRPPRIYEENGTDYNFLTETEFHNNINYNKYLEYSCFNNWFYGTDKEAIDPDSINVGIFNINGISNLAMHQNEYEILCVYLKCNLYSRIKRSIEREGCFKKEYIRRIFTDNSDFKDIKQILRRFSNYFIFDSNKTSAPKMIDYIIWRLKVKNLCHFI